MYLVIEITVSFCIFMWFLLPTIWGAPFISSNISSIKKMLQLIEIQPNQTLIDLGAGDGRIIILASLLHNAQCTGIEIDPIRYMLINLLISILGLRQKYFVELGNLYNYDLSKADVVTMFLLPSAIDDIKSNLISQLNSQTKVVSFKFEIPDWTPILADNKNEFFIYEIQ